MPRVNADHQRRQRERIIVAAEGCFVDSGFHTASMDEIVSRAGMSSSTVYSYFPGGKRELIRAVCTNRLEPVYDEVEEYANREDPPSLSQIFKEVFGRFWNTHRGSEPEDVRRSAVYSARLAINAWSEVNRDEELRQDMAFRHDSFRGMIVKLVKRWQSNGQVDPRLDPDDVVTAIVGMYFGIIVDYVIMKDLSSLEAVTALERILRPRG